MKYTFPVSEFNYGTVTVEAETLDKALELADEAIVNGAYEIDDTRSTVELESAIPLQQHEQK